MSATWCVYVLRAPDGAVRYVGTTNLGTGRRLLCHLSAARKACRTAKDRWVRTLLDAGKRPTIEAVEWSSEPYHRGTSDAGEARWIGRYLLEGAALLNEHNVERARALVDLPDPALTEAGRDLYRIIDRRRATFLDVAKAVGVAPMQVGNWINGVTGITDVMRERLAAWVAGEMDVSKFRGPGRPGRPRKGEVRLSVPKRTERLQAARAARRAATEAA